METQALERYRAAEIALWASYGVRPDEHWVDLRNPRVRLRVQETGAGAPAVFIHGGMMAGACFAPLIARLGGLRCIVPDRPGCGCSEGWALATTSFRHEAVDVIAGTFDAFDVAEATLVAHSLGCLWAVWFALANPARVRRVVLLGSSIGFPGVTPPLPLRILTLPIVGDFLLSKQQADARATLRRVLIAWGHQHSLEAGRISEQLLEWMCRLMTDTPTQQNDIRLIRRLNGMLRPRNWARLSEHELRSIGAPTVFISGDADRTGGSALERRAALVPNARFETLRRSGHTPWFDDPAFVAEAILRAVSG